VPPCLEYLNVAYAPLDRLCATNRSKLCMSKGEAICKLKQGQLRPMHPYFPAAYFPTSYLSWLSAVSPVEVRLPPVAMQAHSQFAANTGRSAVLTTEQRMRTDSVRAPVGAVLHRRVRVSTVRRNVRRARPELRSAGARAARCRLRLPPNAAGALPDPAALCLERSEGCTRAAASPAM
jgi:hypothetical protein